jgi:4'-phosphopantetheinyl transferase EntD
MTSVLRDVVPHADFVAEGVPRLTDEADLYAEEVAYIRAAVPQRRAEFATARVCARRGLAAMGIALVPLVPAADRAPAWPNGVVGSITHTLDYCAVALGRRPSLRSVGIDAEKIRELDDGVTDLILTDRERAWLHAPGRSPRSVLEDSLLVFSAKEAFYKCQFPVTHRFLEFRDVEVDLPRNGRFSVTVLKRDWPGELTRMYGRFAFDSGRVLCGVELLA